METTEKEAFDRLEERLVRMERTIDALGRVLIRRRTATGRAGISGSTLDRHDDVKKFEEIGHDRTFIEIGDVSVIRRPPRRKARATR